MNKYILVFSLAIIGLTVSCSNDNNSTGGETTTPESAIENSNSPNETTTVEQPEVSGEVGTPIPSDGSAPATSTAAPSNVATIPNPAHGEPKHRCEVAVGAPIPADGSAPAVTSQAPPQPQNIQMQSSGAPQTVPISPAQGQAPSPAPTTIMNAPQAAPPTAGTTAPGMNPPHGEPGHDCAIPVGSPLKK